MGTIKPAVAAKSNMAANAIARAPPTKPYNGYKMDQKLVQQNGSSARPSSQPRQTAHLPDHKNGMNTSAACFECGQTGHLQASCPHLKQNVRNAAIRANSIGVPEKETPTEDPHPQDKEGEGKEQTGNTPKETGAEMPGEWGPELSQYGWDEEEEEEMDNRTITYRSNAIRIVSDEHTATKIMAACARMTASNKVEEPMYHHRSKYRSRPERPQSENSTLSGYWEINGV